MLSVTRGLTWHLVPHLPPETIWTPDRRWITLEHFSPGEKAKWGLPGSAASLCHQLSDLSAHRAPFPPNHYCLTLTNELLLASQICKWIPYLMLSTSCLQIDVAQSKIKTLQNGYIIIIIKEGVFIAEPLPQNWSAQWAKLWALIQVLSLAYKKDEYLH